MTTMELAAPSVSPGGGTAPDPRRDAAGSTRRLWRAARLPLALAVIIVVGAALLALGEQRPTGALDPRGVDPQGSHALAVLLGDRGVRVHRAVGLPDLAQARGTGTVFLPYPDLMSARALRGLAALPTGARLVLVAPGEQALGEISDDVRAEDSVPVTRRDPGCRLPVAGAAGDADLGGLTYRAPTRCYDGALARGMTRGGASLTVLGSGTPFTNDRLASRGNAALALGLLGQTRELAWLLPGPGEQVGQGRQSLTDLLPGWALPAAAQLVIAGLLLALWRGRRLGPVVTEPLPVVVRAAEAVEGRSRLYQRGRARDRAAAALREGARARLLPALGVGSDPPPHALVEAVAGRTGRATEDVGGLLYGAIPRDDAALVRLADGLDRLVDETLRPHHVEMRSRVTEQ